MVTKRLAIALLPLTLLALACGEVGDIQTLAPLASEATVQGVVTETETEKATVAESDIEETISARVQATVHALFAATPIPSPTPTREIPVRSPTPTTFTTITGGAFNTSTAPIATSTLLQPSIPTTVPSSTSIPTATPRPIQLNSCSPASDGTVITAWVNGIQAASTTVSSGNYILLVEQVTGASFSGQMINFKVGTSEAKQTVLWAQGGATELVLSTLGDDLSDLGPAKPTGGPLAQPLPPHAILGTVFIGDC